MVGLGLAPWTLGGALSWLAVCDGRAVVFNVGLEVTAGSVGRKVGVSVEQATAVSASADINITA